jgi:hypothetical protein
MAKSAQATDQLRIPAKTANVAMPYLRCLPPAALKILSSEAPANLDGLSFSPRRGPLRQNPVNGTAGAFQRRTASAVATWCMVLRRSFVPTLHINPAPYATNIRGPSWRSSHATARPLSLSGTGLGNSPALMSSPIWSDAARRIAAGRAAVSCSYSDNARRLLAARSVLHEI